MTKQEEGSVKLELSFVREIKSLLVETLLHPVQNQFVLHVHPHVSACNKAFHQLLIKIHKKIFKR